MGITSTAIADAATAPCWLLTNVVLAMFAWRASGRFVVGRGSAVHVCAAILVALSTILAATLVLGIMGVLDGWILMWLVASTAAIGFAQIRAADGGLAAAVSTSSIEEGAANMRLCRSAITPNGWTITWVVATAIGVGHIVVDGLLRLPTDFDSLMYHMPIINEWLQNRSLYSEHSSYWWTPGTSEVIALWMVGPYSGDFLLSLNNVPIVVLWATATFAMAREQKLPRGWSHLVALASLTVYTTLHETDDASNDLAIVAYFMAGALFALRFVNRRRRSDLVFMSLALGVLCGVKYNALGYATLLWVCVVCLSWKRERSRTAEAGRPVNTAETAATALTGMLLLGSYWYVRNWLIGGSPIYPMGLGEDIATGYPDVWRTTLLGNGGDPRVLWFGLSAVWRLCGPIHLVGVALSPLMALGLAIFANRIRTPLGLGDRRSLMFLAMLLFGSAVLWMLTPWCAEDDPQTLNQLRLGYTPIRYGLCFLTIAVISLAVTSMAATERVLRGGIGVTMNRWPRAARFLAVPKSQVVPCAVFAAMLIWQGVLRTRHAWMEFNFVDSSLIGLNVILASVLLVLLGRITKGTWRTRGGAVLGTAATLFFAVGVAELSADWHRRFGTHFDRMFAVNLFTERAAATDRVPQAGESVCVLAFRVYPFFGSRRGQRVVRPRLTPSYESLVDYLRTTDTEIVVTNRANHSRFLYHQVDRWLRENPDEFENLWDHGDFAVFRRKQQRSATAQAPGG